MNKRIKKKHEHRYWLRNAKERRVTWQEFLEWLNTDYVKEQEHEDKRD